MWDTRFETFVFKWEHCQLASTKSHGYNSKMLKFNECLSDDTMTSLFTFREGLF